MISLSDDQNLEHFKESFPPNTESQFLEINYIYAPTFKHEFWYCCLYQKTAGQKFFNASTHGKLYR